MRHLRHHGLAASASLFLIAVLAASILPVGGAQAQDEAPEQFPEGLNRDDTFYTCTACHNFKLVAAQGLSRERWDDTITLMSEKHNMVPLEGDDRKKVLDYLSTTFPPRPAQQGRGWQNPFSKK